jgi:hypothetical protein
VGDSYWLPPEDEERLLSEATRRRASFAQTVASLTPEQLAQAKTLTRQNSNLSAGLLQALTQAQVPPEIEQALIEKDEGGVLDRLRDDVGDLLGNVVGAGGDVGHAAVSQLYERAIKPAVRGLFITAESLAHEVVQRPLTAALATVTEEDTGFLENYGDYGASPLVNAITRDVDSSVEGGTFGKGFFAGGQADEATRRQRILQINGRKADVGQAIAGATVGHFIDPGDRLYDAVAGVSGFAVDVGLDPLAWVTGGASKAIQAGRVLKAGDAAGHLAAVGAINGARRNTVLVERASDFFRDERLLGKLAEADAFTIAKSWGKSPANRLDMETIGRLGNATEQSEVAEILLEAVAHGDVTKRGLLRGPGHFVRTTALKTPLKFVAGDGKLSGLAPKGVVSAGSVEEIGEAAFKVDSLLRQANVGQDLRRTIFNDMATLEPGDFAGLFDITTDALEAVAVKVGPEAASLRNVAQKYAEDLEAFRQYGVDSWGDAVNVPYAQTKLVQNFDGQTIETILPSPQMTSELNSLALHLPDPQDIRRAATKNGLLRSVYTSKGWDGIEGATRKLTGDIFKPLALLRPAYILRIGAEEQARLTAAGYDSVFNHPFRWLQANVRSRDAVMDLTGDSLEDVARATDIITKDAHGVLADKAASQGRVFGITSVKLDEGGKLAQDSYRGWKGELGQISAAPEGRKMAELRGNLTEFKAWAQTEGLESITKLSRVNDEAGSLLDFGTDFDTWAAGLARRVEAKTGGFDEDLIERVVSRNIPWANATGKQAQNSDAAFHSFLSAKARAGLNPAKVKVENVASPARMKAMDTAVDWLFDHITGKPTSYLARFPAFRQSMVKRGVELMDALDSDGTRRTVLEAFEKNMGLTNDEFAKLAQAAQNATGAKGVISTVDDFNEVLIGKAAQDAKDLLFDVTKRGATQDAMVAIMPFLDAWKEVTLTWSRLVKENPSFFIRAQAGYHELQEQGTFYQNEFGQEVFRYPGGGFLSTFVDEMNQRGGGITNAPMAAIETAGRVITGDTPDYSVAAEGSVQGLNMLATGVGPGFGPIVQWGATVLDGPDTRRLREFIAPFGTGATDDPEDVLNFGGVVGGLLPAWMRKTLNSVTEGEIDERQYNSMFGDSMRALVASGEYDPADQERLMEDAKRYTDYQLLFRGFVQATGPTGPTLSGQVELDNVDTKHPDWDPENDPTGRMFFLGVMREEYFELFDTYGSFDVAAEKFYEMYGIEPFYVTQAKSTTNGRELPVTREGDDWMSANRDVAERFPLVAGFWAPTAEGAKFDFSAFADQVARGDRKSLSPEDQVALANKARARAMWEAVKVQTEILPAKLRDQARATAQGQLENLHPGWRMDVIVQPSKDDKIAQLQRAAFDDGLDGQPLTQPLREYLTLRSQALERVRLRSGSATATLNREDAVLEKRMLLTAGVRLQQQHPSFRGVWSALLKSELED